MSDLISRQAAIDALGKRPMVWTDNDNYSLGQRNQYDFDRLAIETVPSAEPQERTGKWIHDGSHWANRWICDRCGYKLFGVKTKFCPDCGQRMEVDND